MHRDVSGYYAALGISPCATPEAIRAAYRRRALVAHPDNAQTGSKGGFLALQWAYDTLRDPAKRAAYDALSTKARLFQPRQARSAPPSVREASCEPPSFMAACGAMLMDAAVILTAMTLVN
jgi:DnaJ-class molecular chaperone